MKIAISTDTSSGITSKEAKELGVYVLPMPIICNSETYYEGINLTDEEYLTFLKDKKAKISTSQPSLADIENLWKNLLKEYDEVIHIPLSSGLSGTCQSAMMLAEEFYGKVTVVDNKKITCLLRQSVLEAIELVKSGKTSQEIKEILENHKDDGKIYVGLETLDNLKRGGRLSPAAASLGSLLKIKPILSIDSGDKLDKYATSRTMKGIKKEIINALLKAAQENYNDPEASKCIISVAYVDDKEAALTFAEELKEAFPNRLQEEIEVFPLAKVLVTHTGPGALGATIYTKSF